MASKLPVLWIEAECVNVLCQDRPIELVPWAANHDWKRFGAMVEYLPANHCQTCRFFELNHPEAIRREGYCVVSWTQNGPVRRSVPADGSGFCHNYKPKESEDAKG